MRVYRYWHFDPRWTWTCTNKRHLSSSLESMLTYCNEESVTNCTGCSFLSVVLGDQGILTCTRTCGVKIRVSVIRFRDVVNFELSWMSSWTRSICSNWRMSQHYCGVALDPCTPPMWSRYNLSPSWSTKVDTDVIHVIKWTRPSPSVFVYCKQSKTGRWEGLGTRLPRPISLTLQLPQVSSDVQGSSPLNSPGHLQRIPEPVTDQQMWLTAPFSPNCICYIDPMIVICSLVPRLSFSK